MTESMVLLTSLRDKLYMEIIEGDPKIVLVREAKKFDADCIFVGSRGEGFSGMTLISG